MKQEDLEGGLTSVSEVNKHGIVSDSLTRGSGRETSLKDVVETEVSADIWQGHCWFVSVRPQANKVSDPLTRRNGRGSLENWLALRNKAATSGLRWLVW